MKYALNLKEDEAAVYFLGQAGHYIKSCGRSVLIDPYLSDSCGKDPRFSRLYPVPVDPRELYADIFILTHDHLDHLDPETIERYGIEKDTLYIAPHLTVRHLRELGIPDERIIIIDCGETRVVRGVEITGIFALGTSKDSIDTTGYKIKFKNGKSVYHTADTGYCELLEKSAEYADVMLACINGNYGNMTAEQAAKLAKILDVKYAIPNHYDVMALNSENPELFRYLCEVRGIGGRCRILEVGKPFIF